MCEGTVRGIWKRPEQKEEDREMKAKETKKEESESEDRERRAKRERIKLAHDGSLYRNEKLWKGRLWVAGV